MPSIICCKNAILSSYDTDLTGQTHGVLRAASWGQVAVDDMKHGAGIAGQGPADLQVYHLHAVMLSVAVKLELLRDGYSTATSLAMARVLRVVDHMLWQNLLQDVPCLRRACLL
jgi:hypothetical protein